MRKIATFLVFISFLAASAQGYQRMLADSVTYFQVVPLYIPVIVKDEGSPGVQSANCVMAYNGDWFAKNDSVYNALTYKKFYEGNQFWGLMREDTLAKKVYFIQYCNTNEELLYDFSLPVGGTITYSFAFSGQMPSGTYTVDSIRLKHDYKSYRKHFYLRDHSTAWNPTLEIVEGVGQTSHPLFLYYSFGPGILNWGMGSQDCPSVQFDLVLSCKWDDGMRIYYDSCAYSMAQGNSCVGVSDTCYYQTVCNGIEEYAGVKRVMVYPNPAGETAKVEVEAAKAGILELSLWNTLGVETIKAHSCQVQRGRNKIRLNLDGLANGIYLLKVSDGKKTMGKTLIISH